MEWYEIENVASLDSPSLVIFPDRVKENLRILKQFVPDTSRLRPHVKTNKCAEVCQMMLEAGITKFKCATLAEAEMLAGIGAPDVLLAYQPTGPKPERLAELMKKFPATNFSCLVDNAAIANQLDATGKANDLTIEAYIDVNVGMNRTGILPSDAFTLFKFCQSLSNLHISGLHAYDGHLRDADLAVRTEKCNAGFAPVEKLKEAITSETGEPTVVIAGGTPTFPIHARRNDVECSPGTFIFWDKGYSDQLLEQPFLFAALVVTRVISTPTDGTICVDLGHKSIASENPIASRIHFLNAAGLVPVGHSEEHLVLQTDGTKYNVGDVLYGVPFHICPTVALHETAGIITKHRLTAHWNIAARKRKITV